MLIVGKSFLPRWLLATTWQSSHSGSNQAQLNVRLQGWLGILTYDWIPWTSSTHKPPGSPRQDRRLRVIFAVVLTSWTASPIVCLLPAEHSWEEVGSVEGHSKWCGGTKVLDCGASTIGRSRFARTTARTISWPGPYCYY